MIDASSYKWLLYPLAVRELDRILRRGFPPQLGPALRFLITKRLGEPARALVQRIEALRSAVGECGASEVEVLTAARDNSIAALAGGPGTPGALRRTSLPRVADTLSVPAYWGAFLHLAATASGARTILELGACAGISGCYLATGAACQRFVTVEGSAALAALAASNLRAVARHAEVVHADFESALDQLLPRFASGLDLAFVDGQHDQRATVHYHRRLLPYLNPGSVLVFDDIHYHAGMEAAWDELRRWSGVAASIDLGRMGVCVWRGGAAKPECHDLSRYTHAWGRGKARVLRDLAAGAAR